jgi:hypothetical protein
LSVEPDAGAREPADHRREVPGIGPVWNGPPHDHALRIKLGAEVWRSRVLVGDTPLHATKVTISADARDPEGLVKATLEVPTWNHSGGAGATAVYEGVLVPFSEYHEYVAWKLQRLHEGARIDAAEASLPAAGGEDSSQEVC